MGREDIYHGEGISTMVRGYLPRWWGISTMVRGLSTMVRENNYHGYEDIYRGKKTAQRGAVAKVGIVANNKQSVCAVLLSLVATKRLVFSPLVPLVRA